MKYYMVLIRKNDDLENTISDTLFTNKQKAIREAKRWVHPRFKVEILLYDGEAGDELANYRGTYTPDFIDTGY